MTDMITKTAKDLPVGAEVQTFWTTWTKDRRDGWTNSEGERAPNEEIDRLLANGGMLTRVPTGVAKGPADVLTRVADIIEPHIDGTFKRRARVVGNAEDLARAGLLIGGNSPSVETIVEQAAAVLQCRMDWPTAERIADELSAAGLLKED